MLNRILVLALFLWAGGSVAADEFALRDGDTVVFLGDSITAARTYGKIIEDYTLLRFPGRRIRFFNAGRGGDTAAGGLARIEQDVFSCQPTVLIVAYGTNDIGWGIKADEEHKKKYLDAVRGLVENCQQRKVRLFLCSAAITAEDPDRSETGFLQRMCDEGMALARKLGEQSIDVQRSMRTILKRVRAFNEAAKTSQKKVSLHAADGVHLNELGQLAMAFAILKGLQAPAEVSAVRLDLAGPKVAAAVGCKVTELVVDQGRVAFTRLDEGLPFNHGLFYALNFRFVPVLDELNRYILAIDHLPEGRYEVSADGRQVGTYPAKQLAHGVNLASVTANAWQPGGPWDAQASVVQALTDSRHHLAVANVLARSYLRAGTVPQELAAKTRQTDDELTALQRLAARPRPYRFLVRKAP